jgi:hypothetical protein
LKLIHDYSKVRIKSDDRIFRFCEIIDKIFVDRILATDQTEWQTMEDKLYQARLQFKPKTKSFNLKNNHIYSSDEDKDIIERFDKIRGLCDQFAWNIFNNDSHLVSFSTYKMSNKLICSLSDVDLNSTSEYICEYGSYSPLFSKIAENCCVYF